jgi:predicted transcriptional regulator
MKIKHHVQKDFEIAYAYAGIKSVEKRLVDNSFVVVFEGGSFKGILTPSDIIKSSHMLAIDCLHKKPRISCDQGIESVLKVMKENRNHVLPVFDGNDFIGVVLQGTITDFLFEYNNELKHIIAERTAELKKVHEELEQHVEIRTSELMKTTKELQCKQEELLRHKLDLVKVNKELLETNNALSVLARNIDINKEEAEKKIALTINSNIVPIIKKLKDCKTLKKHQTDLDTLTAYLNDITSSLLHGADVVVNLSPSEMRVASMIKNELTSKEIATKLYICLDTVKTHRRNIRKKLKIYKSDISLSNYLRQKWSEG